MLNQKCFQLINVHIALKRVQRLAVFPLLDHKIIGECAAGLYIAARRIKMGVGRNISPFAAHYPKQYGLGGPALVGRNDMLERHQVLHSGFKAREGWRAGVAFVATHHSGPLFRAHGTGTAIR